VVLIGAAALGCHFEMTWRRTNDLDLTFVAEPEQIADELRALGWIRDLRIEHRWTSTFGTRVDVLPASPALLAAGTHVFSETGQSMNLAAFALALAHYVALELEPGLSVDVASVPTIAVLKMAAWLDRLGERDRDLEDLAHIFDEYLSADDPRRWGDDLIEAGVPYEHQSAFVVGQDIAEIVLDAHVGIVAAFLEAVGDESRPPFARLARCIGSIDPVETLNGRLNAIRAGLARSARAR
jgi:predicted nucleotidyltransferase